MSAIARHDSQWFTKFLRKGELVKQLELLLNDERWEVQHQTLKFLLDALPTFGTVNKIYIFASSFSFFFFTNFSSKKKSGKNFLILQNN